MNSNCSLAGTLRWCDSVWTVSVLDYMSLGSTMSVRETFGRFASSLSVLDFAVISSSVSLRDHMRAGNSLSICNRRAVLGAT